MTISPLAAMALKSFSTPKRIQSLSKTILFQGNEPASQDDNKPAMPSKLIRLAVGRLLLLPLLIGGGFVGVSKFQEHQRKEKAIAQEKAQKEAQEEAAEQQKYDDTQRNVIRPLFLNKLTKPRQETIEHPFCEFQDDQFIGLEVQADWQLKPTSKLYQRYENSFFKPGGMGIIEAYNFLKYYEGDLQGYQKDVEKGLDKILVGHIHPILGEHASRFLKKHTLQEWTQHPEYLKQFQQEFEHGGTDFEGKPAPGIQEVLEKEGIQLNSPLQLKALKAVFGKIVLPFAQNAEKTPE